MYAFFGGASMTSKQITIATIAIWAIISVIALAAVATAIGWTKASPDGWFAKNVMRVLLGQLLSSAITAWRVGLAKRTLPSFNIEFEGTNKKTPELSSKGCFARTTVHDKRGVGKEKTFPMEVSYGYGDSWSCKLLSDGFEDKPVTLILTEHGGKTWQSRPIYPYVKTVSVKGK
jgi:hypothetical protein